MKNVFNTIISFIKAHMAIVVAAAVAVTAAGIGIGIAVRNRQQTEEPPVPTKHEHSYTVEIIPSTCGHGGYTLHSCDCGDSYRTDETDPLPHEYGEWVVTIDATVDNEGQQEKHCLHCNDRIIEVIPQVEAHEHVYEDETVDPTCTEKGYTLHTCSICGYQTSDMETDATGHSWSNWEEIKPATATDTGEQERTCQACGEAESAVIPMLTPSHTHVYTDTVVAPTCTEKGYTLHICTTCGYQTSDTESKSLGHSWSIWKEIKPATTATAGKKERTCKTCGKVEKDIIPMLVASSHGHTYTKTVVAPTCTESGYTLSTCTVCGHYFSDTKTSALGHSWSDWKEKKPATATVTGKKQRFCKTCGEVESAVIPMLNPPHTHEYTETVIAPTCTEAGYTLHSCECGHSYTDNETSKVGHLYGSWETTKKPTTTQTGERQCVCSRCGHVNIESIDKLTTEQDNAYTSYIDPRITIETTPGGATTYFFTSVRVIDTRTWGDPPSIKILDNDGFYIVYYQQDGTRISYSLNPVEGYVNRFVILETGSYRTQLIGDYND